MKDYLLANVIPIMGDDVPVKCSGCNKQVYLVKKYLQEELPVMCTSCLYGPKEN